METYKILKYLKGSATSLEKNEVEDWLSFSEENTKTFNFLMAQHLVSTFDVTSIATNTEEAVSWYKRKIKESFKDSNSSSWIFPLKCAAMIAMVFGSAYLFYINSGNLETAPIAPNTVITLQLENGDVQVIEELGNKALKDSKGNTIGTQNGNVLHYSKGAKAEKLVYNTLTVPYGKRFDIVLSDNTHVFLNAGSSLRYPVNFIKGKNREVFLEGEAFFEVTKDTQHPFVVNAHEINVRVLGTKFNVSAYPESLATKTVLVEGAVGLYKTETYKAENATLMTPGDLATLDKKQKI